MSMEIANNYGTSATFYSDNKKDVKKSDAKKTEAGGESTSRKSAADELAYLSKKYDNCTFIAANYKKGMRYGSMETTNIAISPAFLKKMAENSELEKEYESYFTDMQRLDAENIQRHEAQGRRIVAQGWAIDKDGGISRWGISEPKNVRHVGQEMNDYAEKIRKANAEKKKEQEKIDRKRQDAKAREEELKVGKENVERSKRNTGNMESIAVDIRV